MYQKQIQFLLAALGLALIALLLFGQTQNGSAAPALQLTSFPTPTPGPDGRIIYIVQPGDTLWRVSAITGITLDELRSLNNLGPDSTINEGQQLILGLGGPVQTTVTAGPSPTPTSRLPTPTYAPGSGTMCVIVYHDENGDSLRQETEASIPGGEVSITAADGDFSHTYTTESGLERHCFDELDEGQYNLTVAIPDGYNATSVMSYELMVNPGSETYVDFGAQPNSDTLAEAPTPQGSGKSPMLAVGGVMLLAGGAALGFLATRVGKKKLAS